ncbi:ribokinase [Sphingomonas sp.]|uniref:ribokinase n=1 Tax=Sphingomonas sp. TaxID=28214 RepID=UPI000DB7AD5E|nr:ribokinase [Sphingomonas sp.]PZU08011.1 MAG: ribokinase [Sphingomonas sp.]
MAVLVIGSINLDLTFRIAGFVRPGETMLAEGLTTSLGGKGANQAVAAARLGAAVTLAGAVGTDAAAGPLVVEIAAAGVDVAAVERHRDSPTGMASIALADGENSIIVAQGANAAFSGNVPSSFRNAAGVTALFQLEIGIAAIERALDQLGQAPRVILNAAPARPEARPLLARADIVIVNESELEAFVPAASGEPAFAERARALLGGRLRTAILTLGAEGCLAVTRDRADAFAAPVVDVVDTVGAGDCFCGALSARLDAGDAIDTAIAFAIQAAALAVTKPGAAASMPTLPEVTAMLAGNQTRN